ncbi:hypothetical protein PIB30_037789 [Stylosanthes scabra]|uniref:Uncharacterized protein n=1 Tax=Stylosanthes scabra TaxID=79078 RepID=A0ABU6XCN5_9FABA|nr:hypothetical protein [Stylosanthes scabra]
MWNWVHQRKPSVTMKLTRGRASRAFSKCGCMESVDKAKTGTWKGACLCTLLRGRWGWGMGLSRRRLRCRQDTPPRRAVSRCGDHGDCHVAVEKDAAELEEGYDVTFCHEWEEKNVLLLR